MGKATGVRKGVPRVAAALACGLFIATRMSQAAAMPSVDGAEQLHRLDVMLQATGRHCSTSRNDFRQDYAAFAQAHRSALSQASREVRAQMAQRYGTTGASSAVQHMDARMTAEYKRGHPWLDCEELQTVTRGLVMVQGSTTLVEAADQILPRGRDAPFAMAHD